MRPISVPRIPITKGHKDKETALAGASMVLPLYHDRIRLKSRLTAAHGAAEIQTYDEAENRLFPVG